MPSTPMYRVTQVATGVAGSPYYITGYFDQAGGTAQAAASAWRAAIGNTATRYRSPMRYDSISTVDIVDPVTGDLLGTAPVSVGSLQFTSTADILPPANTMLLRWRTGVYVGGREVRGHTNLSGFTEDNSVGGIPDSSILSLYTTSCAALLSDVSSRFVVWSRKNGTWEEVTTGAPATYWAVLRSRRD